MRINSTNNQPKISFKYKSILKTYWRENKLPTVIKDIYGDDLIEATVEHIRPHSKGGKSTLFNYVLANPWSNCRRGSDDIMKWTNYENVYNWFKQFVNVDLPLLNGGNYIKNASKPFGEVGKKVVEQLKSEGLII